MGRGPLWVWLSHASMASRGNSSLPTARTHGISPLEARSYTLRSPRRKSWASSFVVRYLLVYAPIAKSVADSGEFSSVT